MVRRPTSTPAGVGSRTARGRLHVFAVGDETVASTRYRILAHLESLREAGFETEVSRQARRPASRLLRLPLRVFDELRDLAATPGADLLLIQRRCYPPVAAKTLRARGLPIVFDVDDAVYLPSPTEQQTHKMMRRYRRNFDATAAIADLVLCGNRELATNVGHQRTMILPTAIDCERFHPNAIGRTEDSTVGWVGHSGSMPYLEALAEPLRWLAEKHPGFRLVVVADRPPRLDGVPVEFREWRLENEVSCFEGMRVGIMPLPDTLWNRAKCAFKLIQYMALGIPSVGSPVGMNKEVIRHGENGFLAKSATDWLICIDELLSQGEVARRIAAAGRRTVEEEYSLPIVSRRMITALDRVLEDRRRSSQSRTGCAL